MPHPRPNDDQAIDRWLQQSLRERYADALREPVPQDLLDLLDDIKG